MRDPYVLICVKENTVTGISLEERSDVPIHVHRLLQEYGKLKGLQEMLEALKDGESEGGDWAIDKEFQDGGRFSAYCYLLENYDIYAIPLPQGEAREDS